MKKFMTLLLATLVILSSVAAAANKPVRIARLPIIVNQNKLDSDTVAALETKLARAVAIPLNKTLEVAEYLPPKNSAKKLQSIWKKMYAQNKNSKMTDAVKNLAQDINADIVVCPILTQYSQRVTPSNLNFESKLTSAVSAELIVYDSRTDNLIDKKVSRHFNDSYNRFGTASYLAGECFDQLIEDTNLRTVIRNVR